jgi:hypothetical protein
MPKDIGIKQFLKTILNMKTINPFRSLARFVKVRIAERRRKKALVRLGVLTYYNAVELVFDSKKAAKKFKREIQIIAYADEQCHSATVCHIKETT